jgi:hypothetical protein
MYEDRPKVDWAQDRAFEDEHFIIQVTKLPLRWPRYNYTVCCKGKEGKIMRFIPVAAKGQGKIEVRRTAQQLASLITQAEDYIEQQLQQAEDVNIAERQEREGRSARFNGPVDPPMGLKRGSKEGWKNERRDRERERGA